MNLEIYEKHSRKRLDIIRMVKYVQYNDYFNGIGKFKLIVPYNEKSLPNLVEGNYIYFENGIMGVIKYREKETSESTTVTIQGYIIKKILEYRCFLKTKVYKKENKAQIATDMVRDLCIENEDERRNISCISVSDNIPEAPRSPFQNTGDMLNVVIERILDSIGYGYELKPKIIPLSNDTNIESFVFRVLKPTDRTIGNKEGNVPVVFSFDLNNISSMSFVEDSTSYKTTVVVAGEGEGEERFVVESGDLECSDIDRIELYVDARDLQQNSEEKQLTDEEYIELLKNRGDEKLSENGGMFISFDGEVIPNGNNSYKYGTNYVNGDYVTVRDKDLKLDFNLQITGVTKTVMENGEERFNLRFGKDRMTIQEAIRRGGILNG